MRKVAILGIGQTKVDEHWDKSLRELGGEAAFAAMQDAGLNKVQALFVGNMLSPLIDGQNHLGTLLADWIGLQEAPERWVIGARLVMIERRLRHLL